jgi:hypothetical protein
VAKFDKVIPPGQEGKIEVSINGEKVHGTFSKTATVESNDPLHAHMTIAVEGTEIPYLNIVPEGTVYLHGRYGEVIEKKVKISSNEELPDFKVTGVTSNVDDKVTYRVEPGEKAGEYTLHVFKNSKLPTMSTFGNLFIHTNSKDSPESKLEVQIMTKGSISVSPTSVNFGVVKFTDENGPGTPATRSIVASKATGKFAIKEITVNNPEFVAALEPVTPGQQYRIQVTFTPPARNAVGQTEFAEMVIHTDDPMEPELRVQLLARAR